MKTVYILGIMMMFNLFGCAKPNDRLITILGQQYLVPANETAGLDANNIEPSFAVIRKSISNIKYTVNYRRLDYDYLSSIKMPVIFGVGFTTYAEMKRKLLKFEVDGTITYCIKDDFNLPVKFSCGIFIVDGDVNWTVNFSKEHLSQSVQIKAEAENVLRKYREAAHAKRG